jgi:hypothetical protein|tara:strand:- start:4144 stop:4596 length:453 start_codon:yes stop_codon:yes gene_type:complete
MIIFRVPLIAIFLATAVPSLAQTTPEAITDAAFEDFKKGDAKKVIENLLAKAPVISVGPAEKTNLINTLNTYLSSHGKVEGWNLVHSRKASDRFVKHFYMVFQENYAQSWEISFYRTTKGWTIVAFSFDDKLDDLLEAEWLKTMEQLIEE